VKTQPLRFVCFDEKIKRMQKIVLTYGLIAGAIVSVMILGSIPLWNREILNFYNGEIVGYTTMVIALSMIFFGIKSCRDYHFKGSINFWQGVKIGLLITLIASIMYAVAWEFSLNVLAPDFSDKMWQHYIDNAKNGSQNDAEIETIVQEVEMWKEWYENPFLRFALILLEIVTVGVVITIISAAILRKKQVMPA
jgi:hypothetical protein